MSGDQTGAGPTDQSVTATPMLRRCLRMMREADSRLCSWSPGEFRFGDLLELGATDPSHTAL